jgi:hypothetical protein
VRGSHPPHIAIAVKAGIHRLNAKGFPKTLLVKLFMRLKASRGKLKFISYSTRGCQLSRLTTAHISPSSPLTKSAIPSVNPPFHGYSPHRFPLRHPEMKPKAGLADSNICQNSLTIPEWRLLRSDENPIYDLRRLPHVAHER